MSIINMAEYGLFGRFEAIANERKKQYVASRIISQEKGLYRLVSENGEQLGEISGRLRHNAVRASDYPAVGDFVLIDRENSGGNAVIHEILPRKSAFIRKVAGASNEEQVIAANIDTIFICMSLNNDFNLRRLERYLSLAWDSGATPVVVLTKYDLCRDLATKVDEVKSVAIGADIVYTSSLVKNGYTELLSYIKAGKTIAFIGSSGVGKSTLINRLLDEDRFETNSLRNDDKGRHTTTRRELIMLKNGGMVIDTPGMRELGILNADDGLGKTFADIELLASKCRFRNCTHTDEPDCAIIQAISDGVLSEDRWLSYQKLQSENRYNENNARYLAEKRQKFKTIAKINKSTNDWKGQ